MTDAEKLQEALELLVAAVRKALERRKNLGDHRQRRELEDAFDRYCNVVTELHGSDE